MNGVMRTAYYARVSGHKQVEEMTIDSQRRELLKRIEKDGAQVSADFAFCDEGHSGSHLLRPSLESLRDKVAASLIDRLYVLSPDRLARKLAHQALLLDEFERHRCEIVFLNQVDLPESPEANLLLQMQGMIAEYEREKILERTRRGRRHSATCGNVSVFSGAPYGYRYTSKAAGNGKAAWEIDPEESKTVQLMFDLYCNNGFSIAGVARELNSRRIPTRKGKPQWDKGTVRGILGRSAYFGEARYLKKRLTPRKPGKRPRRGDPSIPRRLKVEVPTAPEEQIVIPVPAIVSKSLFDEARSRMENNRKRRRSRSNGPAYLLSGFLVCGECGSAYCGQRPTGKYFYYRCCNTKQPCDCGSVRGDQIEACAWQELCKLLQDPARLEIELQRRQSKGSATLPAVSKAERQERELRNQIDRLIDAYTTGLVEKAEFEKRIASLRDRHDNATEAVANLKGQLNSGDHPQPAIETLTALREQIADRLDHAPEELKRELLELLVKRIEIHRTEVRIVYKVPQRPFAQSLDNRGFLKHWVSRRVTALQGARSLGASVIREVAEAEAVAVAVFDFEIAAAVMLVTNVADDCNPR